MWEVRGADTVSNDCVLIIRSLSFSPSGKTTSTVQAGYYSGGSLSSNGAYDTGYSTGYSAGNSAGYNSGYNAGYAQGVAKAQSTTATVTYTVRHTHVDGCYSRGKAAYFIQSHDQEYDADWGSTKVYGYATCSVCGQQWHCSGGPDADWRSLAGDAEAKARDSGHLVNGMCYNTTPSLSCGKTEGIRTTTNTATLGTGDTVISAVVNF